MSDKSEPRNPFYLLLLLVGMLFVVTLLAVVLVPILMDKAQAAGAEVPKEGFHQLIKRDGIWWVVAEVVVLVILSIASMVLDRLRTLQKERAGKTIPPCDHTSLSN
jgi:heme/copper-type cytochrome/quinol oxidase subunit 2